MLSEAMSQALVRFGVPGFWLGLGVVQWFWPAAIFTGLSNERVTPGARGFAVTWLLVGSVLAFLFIPQLEAFSGLFIPGFALLLVGVLQRLHPAWEPPAMVGGSRERLGMVLTTGGLTALIVALL